MKYKKVTTLSGYYATGDYDSFCFGKCSDPDAHYDFEDSSGIKKYNDETNYANLAFDLDGLDNNDNYPIPSYINFSEYDRVYFNDCLPDENSYRKRYGNWKITVEFEPLIPSTNELDALASQVNEILTAEGAWKERIEQAEVLLNKMKTVVFEEDNE